MIKAFISELAENTYVIKEKNKAIIIDPGANVSELKTFIDENALDVMMILLTHGHVDHIFTLNECIEEFQCDVYLHELEREFLFDPNLNLSATTYKRIVVKDKSRVKTFSEKDEIKMVYNNIEITHLPGHSRGSVSFKYKNSLFSGDTIFKDAVGRTDLPTGNSVALERSINRLLHKYKDNTVVYPGHGAHTTILSLKSNCPYYRP